MRNIVAVLMLALAGAALAEPGAAQPRAATPPAVDIEIAFDTTSSMEPSLRRAKRNAAAMLAGVRAAVPGARFAVVSFRDYGNPGGEYAVVERFTSDPARVERAIGRLVAVKNTSAANGAAESYNLAFRQSYADRRLAWRPAARKIVVVIGDAEPYGAGAAGLPGCSDRRADPHGLNTARELAAMRTAKRTLVMIRELTPETSASLQCYGSMAERASAGGAALDVGRGDLVRPFLSLVNSALASVSVAPAFRVALPGKRTSLAATVHNPNGFPIEVASVSVALPAGFAYRGSSRAGSPSDDRVVTFTVGRTLPAGARMSVRVDAVAGSRPGRETISAEARVRFEGAAPFTTGGSAVVRVTRALRVAVSMRRARATIAGAATVVVPSRASTFRASGRPASGSFTVRLGRARVTLRPTRYSITPRGRGVAVTFAARVVSAAGVRCRRGASARVTVVDPGAGSRPASVGVRSSAACRFGPHSWSRRAAVVTGR